MRELVWPFFVIPTVLITLSSQAAQLPIIENKCVNDYAKLIDKRDRAVIESFCRKAKKAKVPMVVVTVRTLSEFRPRPLSLDTFADELFEEWDIEYESARKAIMLVVMVRERQIRIRIGEVFSDKARLRANHIMRRTIGPALGRRSSSGIRKGFSRLYSEVVRPFHREEKRKDFLESQKRGVIDFDNESAAITR